MVHALRAIDQFLHHDFCPGANRYVYWLKRPIGWLLVAAAASFLIGAAVAPQALVMGVAIVSVIVLGLCWPWVSLWGTSASLWPEVRRCHEGAVVRMTLVVRNRWPWPLWGLTLNRDRFLPRASDDDAPVVALARVPGWSESRFEFEFVAQWRGEYPGQTPALSTGFPFGLWQPSRPLAACGRVLVWPRIVPLREVPRLSGTVPCSEAYDDRRLGEEGEITGVREYAAGDSLRKVHWTQTARLGTLVVRQRQASAGQPLQIVLDLASAAELPDSTEAGEWLIRVAASLSWQLHAHYGRLLFWLGDQRLEVSAGRAGLHLLLDTLARCDAAQVNPPSPGQLRRGCFTVVVASATASAKALANDRVSARLVAGGRWLDAGRLHRLVLLRPGAVRGPNFRSTPPPDIRSAWIELDCEGDLPGQLARQWERACG